MVADTRAELLLMAGKIGVSSRWIQRSRTYREHFDICKSMRASALRQGAIAITTRELAAKISVKKGVNVDGAVEGLVSQAMPVSGMSQPGGRTEEVLQRQMPGGRLEGAASENG
jgi:hypothetical protein